MSRIPTPSDVDGRSLRNRMEERGLSETDAVLWTVILVAAAFDVVTTLVGLGQGFQEGNRVARAFIVAYGPPGVGWLKFAALVVLAVVWGALPERSGTAVLAGFAVISLLTVVLNTITLMAT